MPQEIPFTLCHESEQVIKTYECSLLSNRLIGKGIGYLTLTNKRVVYHATTKRLTKRNITQKEMTLDDVAAISSSIGSSINWFRIMLMSMGVALLSSIYQNIMPEFLSHWLFGIALMIPYVLVELSERKIIGSDIKTMLIGTGEKSQEAPLGLTMNRLMIWIYLFLVGLMILGLNVFYKNRSIMIFLLFLLVYVYLFRPGQTFSLVIFSKTAKGPGIMISGVQSVSLLGALTGQPNANDPVAGYPGSDAELLIRELGALVSDFRQLGDHVIAKWQSSVLPENK